ncbi:MAG: efflux RND transporter periplasmic adaptor subunit [Acidaminococcaceae bacterium]|nr:efflux RND transporter periplasmic adaptor subunit [Acidaminococcaceae bacterium]
MNRKILIIVAILLAALGGYNYYQQSQQKKNTDLTMYGNVEIRQADLGFRVAGRINKLYFQEGDKVTKGALLGELDTVSYDAQRRKALADIANLEATKQTADTVLARRQALYAQGAISKEQLDTYQKNAENAAAQVKAAQQLEVVAADSLKDTKLYAPNDGIVITRAKEEGSIVSANSIVYSLALVEPVWVRSYIDEVNLGNIAYGTKAQIVTDTVDGQTGEKRTYQGHIGYISPTAEFTPKTVQTENLRTDLVCRVRVYVDDKDDFLRQGMPVTVKIDKAINKN